MRLLLYVLCLLSFGPGAKLNSPIKAEQPLVAHILYNFFFSVPSFVLAAAATVVVCHGICQSASRGSYNKIGYIFYDASGWTDG